MGAGKTTISDYLSTVFDMEIVEMDQVIEEREEMSIPDIFATYGEEYFRDLETALLEEMQERKNVIISCGGGTALRAAQCGGNEEERPRGPSDRKSPDHL